MIPDRARRVFEGEIFDVYQWEQEMFDGSKETFEALRRPDTVSIIPVVDGKILLAREMQPGWQRYKLGLFGGRVDDGEEPLGAAKRELLEETGFESDSWDLLFTVSPNHKLDWTLHHYVVRDCRKVAEQVLDSGELIEIVPLDFEEFIDIAKRKEFRSAGFTNWILREIVEGRIDEFRKCLFP